MFAVCTQYLEFNAQTSQTLCKTGHEVPACNPSTGEVEAGESVPGHPPLPQV